MIDEDATFERFGYRSDELSFGSHKIVAAICDDCGSDRLIEFRSYLKTNGRCQPCSVKGENHPMFGKSHSEESKLKMSESTRAMVMGSDNPFYGKHHTKESKQKRLSNMPDTSGKNNPMYGVHICREDHHMFGKHRSDETKYKLSKALEGENNPNYGHPLSETHRQRISASQQNRGYEEWESFARDKPYCPLFNESCKESNRDKYNRECFICGLPENENITSKAQCRKLSVHHVDMNKNQGCDGNRWKLVPVCIHCHGKLHVPDMESYVTYVLENEVA